MEGEEVAENGLSGVGDEKDKKYQEQEQDVFMTADDRWSRVRQGRCSRHDLKVLGLMLIITCNLCMIRTLQQVKVAIIVF